MKARPSKMKLNFGKYEGKELGEVPTQYMQWYLCDTVAQKPEVADAFRAELRARWEPDEIPSHMGLVDLEQYKITLAAQIFTEARKVFVNLGMAEIKAIRMATKVKDRYYNLTDPIKEYSTEDYCQAYKKVAEAVWEDVQSFVKDYRA
jgi:HEPN domain-containing protein